MAKRVDRKDSRFPSWSWSRCLVPVAYKSLKKVRPTHGVAPQMTMNFFCVTGSLTSEVGEALP